MNLDGDCNPGNATRKNIDPFEPRIDLARNSFLTRGNNETARTCKTFGLIA